jgi:hypothetical protein
MLEGSKSDGHVMTSGADGAEVRMGNLAKLPRLRGADVPADSAAAE